MPQHNTLTPSRHLNPFGTEQAFFSPRFIALGQRRLPNSGLSTQNKRRMAVSYIGIGG